MTTKQKERLLTARTTLLRWHKKNARRFNWRTKVRSPYKVLLSELMGQQTQATRIQEYLGKFLTAFPTITHLAEASQSEVIRLWQGLGYNRRAINLHRTAKAIVNDHKAKIPNTYTELIALPGIGPYTANAILVFAFEQPVSAIDVNVSRVITRIAKRSKHEELFSIDKIETICNEILPVKSARPWHEALMDLGATICTKRNPKCSDCPIAPSCASNTLQSSLPKNIPINRGLEKQYFGHPKRIWRGRILRSLTAHSINSKRKLSRFLQKEFNLDSISTASLLLLILPELQAEGFIAIDNERLTLT